VNFLRDLRNLRDLRDSHAISKIAGLLRDKKVTQKF
jgi:hypothetical protein